MPDTKNSQNSQTIIGFDYGLKHIGVAVGQTLTKTAEPVAIVKAKDGIPQWCDIEKLLAQWQPDYLVVGLPLNMDDSESDMSVRARKFANRLHGRFGLRVETIDERLSSYAAKAELAENQQGQVRRDKTIDAIAARLILESWLATH
jgi:putative Holliday junction resolvase